MKSLKVRSLAIASVMFAVLSITPISMAYAQNATAKNHVEGVGYSTKASLVKNGVDVSKLKKSTIKPDVEVEGGTLELDAYNMAPNLPSTMEAAWEVNSLIGPISSVALTVYFDDGITVVDNKNVWIWFNSTYANATQHKFSSTGEHYVGIDGVAYANGGLNTITFPLESTSCDLTNE